MRIVEVRALDGPNLFLLQPAIKLEYALEPEETTQLSPAAIDLLFSEMPDVELSAPVSDSGLLALFPEVVGKLHELCGLEVPPTTALAMEEPDHYVVAFGWERRAFAKALAQAAYVIVEGTVVDLEEVVEELVGLLAQPVTRDDKPEMLTNRDRQIPIIAVTGTNGKTTTTRLIASVLMGIGRKVGWTSSAGVLIQHDIVIPGDYTGPSGAARVFEERDVDIAVLETARGGILLRGLGYESNDISVITNVTEDHLGLHGVHTVEGLRDVKSVVAQVTTPDGFVVLNADDPMSLSIRERVSAQVLLTSKRADHPALMEHHETGGWVLFVRDGAIVSAEGENEVVITSLDRVPITFGGRAPHMVENALSASGALLAAGVTAEELRDGLAAFLPQSEQNRGRLNVFTVNGAQVILDFAHNQAGLDLLLNFGRQFVEGSGRLIAVVGTAGDRTDDSMRMIGSIAARQADYTIFKDTTKYLRGREQGEMLPLMHAGFEEAGGGPNEDAPDERTAALRAVELAKSGDAVALMCIEDFDFLLEHLHQIGTPFTG